MTQAASSAQPYIIGIIAHYQIIQPYASTPKLSYRATIIIMQVFRKIHQPAALMISWPAALSTQDDARRRFLAGQTMC